MKTYTFYNLTNGEMTGRQYSGHCVQENTPQGMAAVEGAHDHMCRRFDLDTQRVVAWKPDAPVDDDMCAWAWDSSAERWKASPTVQSRALDAREKRDRLLARCDWVAVRSIELGGAVSSSWKTYRQALRDITQQARFPDKIEWPVEP